MSLRRLANLLGLRAHSGLVDYERDYRIPSVELLREYQRVLCGDGEELFRLRREALNHRQFRQLVPLAAVSADDGPPTPDVRLVGGAAADALRDAAQRAKTFARHAPAPLDDELIDQVLDDTRRLARAYPMRPVPGLLTDLVVAQEQLLALLGRNQAPTSAHRLYWSAAVLSGTLAKASLEFGDPAAASTQAHVAYLCADRCDHDGLRGWVRGMQSLIAYWEGRLHAAVRYAQHGAVLGTGATGTVTALLPACEARAWARLGDVDRALHCVALAERAWDRMQQDDLDAIGGICRCSRPTLSYLIADALSWLPDRTDSVEKYCGQAAAGYRDDSVPDWDFGSSVCVDVLAALTSIVRGAHRRACALLTPLFDIAADARLFSIRRSITRVGDAIPVSGGHADLLELRDQVLRFAQGRPA